VAVRLFVGNMPYGATDADLRAHFSGVGEPSQVVIPVDRETGRPRGFAFVEYIDRAKAEEAIARFNQQPFMGRSLSVSEARPREERGPGGGFSGPRPSGGFSGPRPAGAGGGFAPRPAGAPGGFRSGPPMSAPAGGRNFGPPKKKGDQGVKRWRKNPRGRSRSATPGAWAASTTTATTRRSRTSMTPRPRRAKRPSRTKTSRTIEPGS
jgi:cold-inducible RNA-binding protein